MRQLCWALAVLLAAGATQARAGEAAWGTLKSTAPDKNQFVLTDDGKDKLFTLVDDARIRWAGKQAKLADLKAGSQVVVLYVKAKDGLYAVDVRMPPERWTQEIKGQLKSVPGGKQFVLTADGKDLLFTLTDDGQVITNVKSGGLKDLKTGTNLIVHYVKVHGGLYATEVRTEALAPGSTPPKTSGS